MVPFATGGKLAVRGAMHADDLLKLSKVADDVPINCLLCFVEDTQVRTVDGVRDIEDLAAGDVVCSEIINDGESPLDRPDDAWRELGSRDAVSSGCPGAAELLSWLLAGFAALAAFVTRRKVRGAVLTALTVLACLLPVSCVVPDTADETVVVYDLGEVSGLDEPAHTEVQAFEEFLGQ